APPWFNFQLPAMSGRRVRFMVFSGAALFAGFARQGNGFSSRIGLLARDRPDGRFHVGFVSREIALEGAAVLVVGDPDFLLGRLAKRRHLVAERDVSD